MIVVDQPAAFMDVPVAIELNGFAPRQQVTDRDPDLPDPLVLAGTRDLHDR
jgi:hypothetical protein